eukprot:3052779-Amphidinium_carterae.2
MILTRSSKRRQASDFKIELRFEYANQSRQHEPNSNKCLWLRGTQAWDVISAMAPLSHSSDLACVSDDRNWQ